MWKKLIHSLLFFKTYDRKYLRQDLIAGVTLGAVLIPIGLAFGELAGVSAVTGLKASIIPLLIYTLFSSSRLIIVGPDASTAALVGAAITPLAGGDLEKATTLAAVFALLVGLFLIIGGISKLGLIADFIPKQVLVGFMSALGVMIIIGQLGKILGLTLLAADPLPTLMETVVHVTEAHLPTVLVAVLSIACIQCCLWWTPWLPGQIPVMIMGIAAVKWFGIDQFGIKTVGELSNALPSFSIPVISWHDFSKSIPSALSIALIALTDSILTARAFGAKSRTEVDANQEALALGLSNLAGGVTQTLPVAVSASRTSIAESAGAQSRLVGIIAPCFIMLFMLFNGASLLRDLPSAVLGAVLIMAGVRLIEIDEFVRFFNVRKKGFFIAFVTFCAVLTVGVLAGIFIAVMISCALVIQSLVTVPCVEITDERVKVLEGKEQDFLVLDIGPGIFFANANAIRNHIRKKVNAENRHVKSVLLDASIFVDIDLAAAEMLGELQEELQAKGMRLGLLGAKPHVKEMLEKSGVASKLLFYPSLAEMSVRVV